MTRSPRIPLRDAEKKLMFLMRDAAPRALLGHRPTLASLSEKVGVNRVTLREQMKEGRMSLDTQESLARSLGFSVDWPEWENGSLEAFRERYVSEHSSIEDSASRAVRDTDAKLTYRRVSSDDARNATLASIEMHLMQDGRGYWIGIDVACQPVPVGDVSIGIRRARLKIDCGPASGPTLRERPGYPEPLMISAGSGSKEVSISIANSTSSQPTWLIEASEGPIGVLSLGDESGFCPIRDIAPGDIVTASLKVFLKDIHFSEATPPEATSEGQENSYSFVADSEDRALRNKRAVLAAILKRKIIQDDESDWVTLASDSIRFERA